MMPLRIEGETRSLGAPSDWDEEKYGKCVSLSVVDIEVDGANYMVSAWELTPAELTALSLGAPLYLWIRGQQHPVVRLGVGDPS